MSDCNTCACYDKNFDALYNIGTCIFNNHEAMWFPVNFIKCSFINCFHGINVCLYTVFLIFIMVGQLETTLGTFYAPKYPLSEVVILDFRDPISRLARRFFHHLLRYIQNSYPPLVEYQNFSFIDIIKHDQNFLVTGIWIFCFSLYIF